MLADNFTSFEYSSQQLKINEMLWHIILQEQKKKAENEAIANMSFNEFQAYFTNKIETSKILGEHGYIPSMHKSLDDEEEIKRIILNDGTEAQIMNVLFKSEKDVQSLIEKLDKFTSLKNVQLYFQGFKKQYGFQDYTAAAFYLSALLDNRFRFLFRKKDYKSISRFLNEGIEDKKTEHFNKLSQKEKTLLSNVFLLTEFIPALSSYINRLFDGDKNSKDHFGKQGKEPPYLERNWLMHGYRTRPVEHYEVLQLLNAIDALEEIIDMLK